MERHLDTMKKRNQRMLDAISPHLSFEQRAAIEKQQEAQLKCRKPRCASCALEGKAESNGVTFLEGAGTTIIRPWLCRRPRKVADRQRVSEVRFEQPVTAVGDVQLRRQVRSRR